MSIREVLVKTWWSNATTAKLWKQFFAKFFLRQKLEVNDPALFKKANLTHIVITREAFKAPVKLIFRHPHAALSVGVLFCLLRDAYVTC